MNFSRISFRHWLNAAALAAVLAIPNPARSQQFAADSTVRSILADRVAAHRGMGFVVAVVEKGSKPRFYRAGVSGVAGLPLDSNTVFEIGSITKVFTGALLAEMVSHGDVRLDDPIAKYLPRTVRVPSRNGRQITLLDLATQTSALPRLPNNLRPADATNPYADYTVAQMYQFLAGYTLPRDIGAQYEYSNFGVGLLGHVLSLRAGKSYEDLLKERILDPLGMRDTRIQLSPSMKSRTAQGFSSDGGPMPLWDLPTLAGAGALRSTAADMVKFLSANLDSGVTPIRKVLADARRPRRDADRPGNRIGLGWHMLDASGTTITWHNGGTGGFRTFIGMDEARKRGVILLSNSTVTPDDIAFHLLAPSIPLEPGPGKQRAEIAVDSLQLEKYAGVYQLSPTFQLTITRVGSSLFGQATGQPKVQLFAETETNFFLKVVDAQLTFVRNASGNVDALILHQNGANIQGLRVGKQ